MIARMSTIPALLLARADQYPDRVFARARDDKGEWVGVTGRECMAQVASTAEQLSAMGVGRGDRVAVLGNPHPRWTECDFATASLGAITVGIYPTLTAESVAFQLSHAGVKVLLVEPGAHLERLATSLPPNVLHARVWDLPRVPADIDAFRARCATVVPSDVCAIIYTSGTTGNPKGAVITHGAVVAVCKASQSAVPLEPGDRSLIFLPLAHSLQRIAVYRGLMEDAEAYFCSDLKDLPDVLQVARPQILASVPRMLEKIKSGAEAAVAKRGKVAAALFSWAMGVGLERSALIERGLSIGTSLRIRYSIADRLIFGKVRQRMGGAIRTLACGGARLDPSVARFFHAMGIDVLEAWGLTETCAPATLNRPGHFKFGTVGQALDGVEIRLDTDGEVLVRGPGLFSGYWEDPVATAAAFTEDRYFRSGDIGTLDADGFLSIVDRKKEILVTAGGKKIPPVNIEKRLEGGAIGQAVVIGDDRAYLVALLAPDPEHPCADREAYARERVRAVNAELATFEQIKRWAWLPGPLTVEDGVLTPTMKLKRKPIAAAHADLIEGMYGGLATVDGRGE